MVKKAVSDSIDRATLRLLDANLNRAREGLRVLEDTARFIWDKDRIFRRFRSERHLLDRLTRAYYPQLVKARGSGQDPGRHLKEEKRGSRDGVIAANFRRCEESLRVLEEYGKLLINGTSEEFKKMRFRVYDLEKIIFKAVNHA